MEKNKKVLNGSSSDSLPNANGNSETTASKATNGNSRFSRGAGGPTKPIVVPLSAIPSGTSIDLLIDDELHHHHIPQCGSYSELNELAEHLKKGMESYECFLKFSFLLGIAF